MAALYPKSPGRTKLEVEMAAVQNVTFKFLVMAGLLISKHHRFSIQKMHRTRRLFNPRSCECSVRQARKIELADRNVKGRAGEAPLP
jgi:hypothetical protein